MIETNEELREMYHGSSVPKQLYIVFPGITLDNSRIFDFSIEESLSSDTDMLFGSCEAGQFRARVEGVGKDIVGQKCKIHHIVDGKYTMPLGVYVIDSVSKKDDLGYREIIGYDEIYTKLSVDVTAWYKSLAFPMPLKTLRKSLFGYVSIPIAEQELIQDDLQIERTIESQALNGRDVAQAIGELNGVFGHIGRDGKFKYVHLGSTGLYPAEDLYPSEELFPSEADSIFESSTVFSCTREEYEVAGIDCLQIRQEEGDVGAVVYDSLNYSNPYIVTGNFLVYGKTAAQLEEIGRTLFNYIKNTPYTPYTAKVIGLPYLEVGDGITFTTKKDNFISFVMKRKLSGIQSLRDELSASGNQKRDNEVSPNMEIEMLKGRSTMIEKSVDGIRVTVADLEADTNSKFEQTSNRITAEVASINKDMSSRFEITTNAINAEVKRATDAEGALSSRINITDSNITAEVTRAKGAEEALSGRINITGSNITAEVKRATKAEGDLSGRINITDSNITAEVTRAKGAEGTLSTKIEQTSANITTQVNGLNGKFTKLEQTVDEFTFSDAHGETRVKGDSITTGTIKGSFLETKAAKIDDYGIGIATQSYENGQEYIVFVGSIEGGDDSQGNIEELKIYGGTVALGNNVDDMYYWINDGYISVNGTEYTDRHIFSGRARFLDNIVTSKMALSDTASLYATDSGIQTQSSIASNGNIVCTGTKNRAVDTKDYGIVLMNALETAGAYFSDIGSGVIINGECYVYPDPIFEETIDANSEYHVLITQTSAQKIGHIQKKSGYFIVYGEEGAAFDWMVIAKQKGYQLERMEAGERIVDNDIEFDESVFNRDYDAEYAARKYAEEYNRDLTGELLEYANEVKNKKMKLAEELL